MRVQQRDVADPLILAPASEWRLVRLLRESSDSDHLICGLHSEPVSTHMDSR